MNFGCYGLVKREQPLESLHVPSSAYRLDRQEQLTAWDDRFDTAPTVDLLGRRHRGALPWTKRNTGSTQISPENGKLYWRNSGATGNVFNITMPAPLGDFCFEMVVQFPKGHGSFQNGGGGFALFDSGNGRYEQFGNEAGATGHAVVINRWNNASSYSAGLSYTALSGNIDFIRQRVIRSGGNHIYQYSQVLPHLPGEWITLNTLTAASWLSSSGANHIGVGVASGGAQVHLEFSRFRRVW